MVWESPIWDRGKHVQTGRAWREPVPERALRKDFSQIKKGEVQRDDRLLLVLYSPVHAVGQEGERRQRLRQAAAAEFKVLDPDRTGTVSALSIHLAFQVRAEACWPLGPLEGNTAATSPQSKEELPVHPS